MTVGVIKERALRAGFPVKAEGWSKNMKAQRASTYSILFRLVRTAGTVPAARNKPTRCTSRGGNMTRDSRKTVIASLLGTITALLPNL